MHGTAAYADAALGPELCAVMQKLLPKVRTYQPVAVQAQLVGALDQRFDASTAKFRQALTEIDAATTASCPKDRKEMLSLLKMDTLREAVR